MVGTTRFELATSPTPRVRSTRLSHVPTCYDCLSLLKGPAAGVTSVYTNPTASLLRGLQRETGLKHALRNPKPG
jgi:hypothetical protein